MELTPRRPVPVFPLPGLVVFPHVVVPLHVFELRYRTMVRDALSGERMLALALLKPGWEPEYHDRPEFHPLGCLARFEEVEWLPNDCYDLKLRVLARVELGRAAREFPYRAVRAIVRPQAPCGEDDPLVLSERQPLLALYRLLAGEGAPENAGEGLPFEALVNAVCMALPCGAAEKLALLELDDLVARGRRACEIAVRPAAKRRPPAPGPGGAPDN
ncbi:MAG TPA: LON peptidase substrate-binding domain-containing protein [Candidatus Eisenbacteria bacterium]|nr:LON peptidase substrate-binding domain-containing protein [Candidatus Eisenbacteria bacterium]